LLFPVTSTPSPFVTGIALTKLDGTAKGGIIVSICNALEIQALDSVTLLQRYPQSDQSPIREVLLIFSVMYRLKY